MNDSKLVVTKYKSFNACFKFEEGVLSDLFLEKEQNININDIYIGRVTSVKKDLCAYFVEYQKGVTGYLPFSETFENESFKQGDLVPVLIKKEPIKTKGATLTTKLSVSGMSVVLTTDDNKLHVSGKINKEKAKELKGLFDSECNEYGIILRTNCTAYSSAFIKEEINCYKNILDEIIKNAPFRALFTCLYKGKSSLFQKICSLKADTYSEIVTDNPEMFEELKTLNNVRFYDDKEIPLKAVYSFDKAYKLATDRKVNLKSGGYLIIEPTEALVSIDVNSGCITNRKTKQENTEIINSEACVEVARQMRLRNLSGIIIVDFINTESKEERDNLISLMRKELKKDIVKASVIDITALGLMEITREKKYDTIYGFLSGNN